MALAPGSNLGRYEVTMEIGMSTQTRIAIALLLGFLAGCSEGGEPRLLTFHPIGPRELPSESYKRPPQIPPDPSGYVFGLENLTGFYDVPGEAGYVMRGHEYGFESLSIIVTETHRHGGPPLHTHDVEEAHVVLAGTMDYVMGEKEFRAVAPYIARVPAGVPHTFVNGGKDSLNLIAVFPSNNHKTDVLGPNPFVEE